MIGSWASANRVMAFDPGPRDICVVTLLNGRRAAIDHVCDYEKALYAASELAGRVSVPVKVLPMGAAELVAFLRLSPADFAGPAADDAEMRELAVHTCRDALLNSDDRTVRQDAHDLLTALGAGG